MDASIAAGAPEPPIDERQVGGRTVAEQTAINLPRGPSALRTTLLMTRVTVREAARRRILWIAVLAAIAFLAFFWTALHFVQKHRSPHASIVQFREGIVMMTMMVLYAGSMMTSLMAALASCDAISGEIAPAQFTL
jgi:ABC-type transport system involved in cytochrome c biogenesis permease subunit